MSDYQNRTIVLARRPHGEVQDEDFRMETEPVRALQPGEFLIKVLWLSLDPYMRPNMNDAKSYAPPMVLGEAIKGESVESCPAKCHFPIDGHWNERGNKRAAAMLHKFLVEKKLT